MLKPGMHRLKKSVRQKSGMYGLVSFAVHTDHKLLVLLFSVKDIDAVPIRCQRLLLRMIKFNEKAEYVPGKLLMVADTLSRNPSAAIHLETGGHTGSMTDVTFTSGRG